MSKKKIFSVLLSIVMVFAFAQGRAIAAEATQVLVELTKNTTNPYDPAPIRGRVLILDAEGLLATTYAGGPVNTAKLIIKSDVFGAEMGVSTQQIEVPAQDLVFPLPGNDAQISLSGAEQEFAISYDDITETGVDKLVVTLKRSNTQFITNQTGAKPPILIDVKAPPANAYVVRTGGIPEADLPDVLETVPPIKNNNDKKLQAGQTYNIDVFAVYAKDSDGAGPSPAELIYTNNVAESAVETKYGTLVDGHLKAVDKTEKIDVASVVDPDDAVADQLADMADVFSAGITSEIALTFPTTRYIGDLTGDVTPEGRLNLQAGTPPTYTAVAPNTLYDTVNYRPGKVSKINLIGLPITDIDNGLVLLGDFLSVKDATTFITDITAKVTDFKVNVNPLAEAPPNQIYAALIGYDTYGNLAPFYQDQTNYAGSLVSFELMGTGTAAPYAGYGTTGEGTIQTTSLLQAFLPIVITGDYPGLYVAKPIAPASPLDPNALADIDQPADARNYTLGNYVTDVILPAINVEAGGNDSVQITVKGSTQENAFNMKAYKATGGAVKVNIEGSDTPKDTVIIPSKEDLVTAEQDVSFYTTAQNQPLRLVFSGLSKKTTFIFLTPPATIEPADPGDYAPSSVSVSLTGSNIYMDIEERHDEASANSAVTIKDAFGNNYSGTFNTIPVTAEDADPIVQVFKSDGTTPFPGAEGEIDNDDLIVSFDLAQVAPETSEAVVNITAGDGSAQFKMGLAALKKTSMIAIYIPLKGTECPVQLNFADQNDKLTPPVVRNTPLVAFPDGQGAFEVELEVIDGFIAGTGIGETTILSTKVPYRIFRAQPADGKDEMTVNADGGDAKAGTDTIVLNFLPDFIPPVVGDITCVNLTANIAVTDNKAFSCENSQVVVKNGNTGAVIPAADYTKSCTGDNTTAGSIDITVKTAGNYIFEVNAEDANGNQSGVTERSADLPCGPPPSCVSVNPAFGNPGDTLDITITGVNTTFGATSEISFSCAGITVASSSVTATATELKAPISIAADAALCASDVTVTTGSEVVTCAGGFEIQPSTTTTITTTTTTIPECSLTVDNTLLPLTAGPTFRIRRIVINGTGSTWDRTSAVSIQDIPIVIPLLKQADRITALIVIPGKLFGRFTPGDKAVTVVTGADDCMGTVTIN